MFQPDYKNTNKIVEMLTDIAEAKSVIERARLLPKQELKLRRQALIRMSHSSTAIEGNILNAKEVEAIVANKKIDAPDRDVYEVKNYLNALRYIEQVVKTKKPITEKVVLKIHQLVTDKTMKATSSGHFRKGLVHVVKKHFGGRVEVIYTGPEAKLVPGLMADLLAWVQASEKENISPIIVAGVVHQQIAAIHPFSDGNGRTARALATLILYQRGYDFRRLFALEDYYNTDRPAYYAAINIGKNWEVRRTDFTSWLQYFVKGFKEEIAQVKHSVVSLSVKKIDADIDSQVYLDKEQVTILDFLDTMQKIAVSDVMDILRCPKRTAQLHLQKLKKLKMIKQVGKGPASKYVLA
ncbi:MAG: Fic family protein [Patescibacteria group bacterium]